MRRLFLPILLLLITAGGTVYAAKYDWRISYEFEVVNPQRHLIEARVEYVFPATTDEVTFMMRDEDNHYTEGYRQYLRSFEMTGPDGEPVELEEDTLGVYRASGLKGTYNANYFIVMEHFSQPSELGIDDTPLLWGSIANFPGAAVCIYPTDAGGSTIGNIEVSFKLPEYGEFLTPYEKIGPATYRVPSIRDLQIEWWLAGNFNSFTLDYDGDTVVCGVSRERFNFEPSDLVTLLDSVIEYHVELFDSLPSHRMMVAVVPTPTTSDKSGLHSFGAVSARSFNCLLDEKLTPEQLGSQMGLFTYNLLTFWMPSKFHPNPGDGLDWFTTGLLNYLQLKSMFKLGFIDEQEFLAKLSRAYNGYVEQLKRKGISLQTMLTLPNSPDRSIYEFAVVAMIDFLIHSRSGGEHEIEDALTVLHERFTGTMGYSSEDLYSVLDSLGSPGTEQIFRSYVKAANPIEFDQVIKPYGLTLNQEPSGSPNLGFTLGGPDDLTVEYVDPNGPARKAGLKFGDVVTEMRGFRLSSSRDIPKLISRLGPGDEVSIAFMRGEKEIEAEIELGNLRVYKIGVKIDQTAQERALWEQYKI